MKAHPRSIRSNFAWTLAGYAFYAGCQWGMLVLLAKLGTPAMVGQFALGLAISAPLLMFSNLQLRSVLATDTRCEYPFSDYLSLRLCCTLLAMLALPLIAAVSRVNATTFAVVVLVGIAKGVEAVSDIYFGLRQHHEQMQPIARSLIAKGVLSLLAFWSVLRITRNLVYALIGLILAWALVLVTYDMRVSHLISGSASDAPRFSLGAMRRIAWRSLPLGLMAMLVSLNANTPRYFLEGSWGTAALGIFAALVYPMTAGTLVATSLGQAALPVLARHFAAGGQTGPFLRLLAKMSAGGVVLGGSGVLLCLAAGRRLLLALYRPEYAEHVDVLVWLAVAAGLNYVATFLNAGVTATREFSVLTLPYIVQAILAVSLSAWLVGHAGLIGAAWASCGISAAGCAIPIAILAWIHGNREHIAPHRAAARIAVTVVADQT